MLQIYIDGASRGNPGPAGVGAVIRFGHKVYRYKKYLGKTTNNRAEYQALILALDKAREILRGVYPLNGRAQNHNTRLEIDKIICYSDSQLLVRQLRREYKVKDKELGKLFVQAWNLSQNLPSVEYHHIPREKNKDADKLANKAIDES
jgi:ribonuclease HI